MRKIYNSYHAQHGEDRVLTKGVTDVADGRIQVFPRELPDDGVFVDIGASSPIECSNTYHFEMNGWTGICIDADERCIPNLRQVRKCLVAHCVVTSQPGVCQFNLCHNQGLSTLRKIPGIERTVAVEGRTLESILVEYKIGKIDLLSIDTEGSEVEVWRSFNWELHKPTIVILEWYTLGLPTKVDEIVRMFTKEFPYRHMATTGGNLIFSLEQPI